MWKFIKNVIFFSSASIIVSFIGLIIYSDHGILNFDSIPPPFITNNVSLNEKLFTTRKLKANSISIGSSVSLNNLSSEIIREYAEFENYHNLGSWGMRIYDTKRLLNIYLKFVDVEKIILSTYIVDYWKSNQDYEDKEILNFLKSTSILYNYLKHFNMRDFLNNYKYIYKARTQNDFYRSLMYDENGGVPFSNDKFNVKIERWNRTPAHYNLDSTNYESLTSICQIAAKRNIQLYVFNSPIRSGLLDSIDTEKFKSHIDRMKNIVVENGFQFVDASQKKWADSLYVDGSHFNELGASLYTKYCIEEVIKAEVY